MDDDNDQQQRTGRARGPVRSGRGHDRGAERGRERNRGQGGPRRFPNKTQQRTAQAPENADDMTRLLYGIHAIEAALNNPARTISHLLLTENAERRLAPALGDRNIPITRVTPRDLDRRLGADTVHQGALAEVEPLPELRLADLAEADDTAGPLLVLDQVTDPHNVGAILRSAAVFGARAVITTRRHSPPPSAALAKSASGALEAIPFALVQNLGDSLEELAAQGYRIIGLDGEAEALLDETDLTGLVALVLGAEGKGLRERTREVCHRVCRIAAPGPIASLNVSNAAAVALHLAAMQRRKKTV